MVLGNLIGGFIVILVGVTLIPSIADQVELVRFGANSSGSNVTGAASTLLDLTVLFFALGVMAAGVSLAVGGLKNAGLI